MELFNLQGKKKKDRFGIDGVNSYFKIFEGCYI